MMMKLTLVTFVIAAVLMSVITAAQNEKYRPTDCYDGRLCQCRRYLDNDQYRGAKRIVDCLNELGFRHKLSQGAQDPITRALCLTFQGDNIIGSKLRKCVYKKIGLIVNINGVDQWDLNPMRRAGIDYFTSKYSSPDQDFIRNFYVSVMVNCTADPFNFEVFPFDHCLNRADAFAQKINSNPKSVGDLSLDDQEPPEVEKNNELASGFLDVR